MRKLTLALLATLSLSAHAETIDDWTYNEMIDPMTDEDSSFSYTKSGGAHLVLRCSSGIAELVLFNGDYLGNDSYYQLTYRIDSEQAQEVRAAAYSTGVALLLPESIQEALIPANQVVMRVSDYRGVAHTHTFSLIGFHDATGLLSCVE